MLIKSIYIYPSDMHNIIVKKYIKKNLKNIMTLFRKISIIRWIHQIKKKHLLNLIIFK